MKKGFYAILAALAAFALVMTACPTDEGTTTTTPPPPPLQTQASLTSLQLGDLAKAPPEAQPGTENRGASLSAISALKEASLSASSNVPASGGALVTLNLGDTSSRATAKYIIVAKTSGVSDPIATGVTEADFDDATKAITYNAASKQKTLFVDGDRLFVKVTSEDGSRTNYYGFEVQIGRDATLSKVEFGAFGVKFEADKLGQPRGDTTGFTDENQGKIQFTRPQPTAGFVVYITPSDLDVSDPTQGGSVQIRQGETGNFSAVPSTAIVFGDEDNEVYSDVLYIKVVSSNTLVTQYYKIEIILKKSINIPYGTPTTVDAANPDTIWDTGATDWVFINRSNPAEGTYDVAKDAQSIGQAKLMWDEDGIWVYVQVWEKVVSATAGDHTVSSVELFVHESYPNVVPPDVANVTSPWTSQQNGGQYRVGANGEITGSPTTAADNLKMYGASSAVKVASPGMGEQPAKLKINDLKGGYKLIFQAPWKFLENKDIVDGKEIGIELQINATGDDGNRHGVLNWNNITSNSYGSLADYGAAVLQLNNNTMKPRKPAIVTPPAGTFVDAGENVTLSVVAVDPATGTDSGLTYQWYTSTSADGQFTAVTSATSKDYTFQLSGTKAYYYVEITNANVKKVNSTVVTVINGTPSLTFDWQEDVHLVVTSAPVYGFKLPKGDTFADYTKIKLKMKFKGTSPNDSGRLRVWGNYDYFTWTDVNTRPGMGNATPGGLLIGSEDNGTTFAKKWTEYTRALNNRDVLATAEAIKASKDVILLAIAPVPPGGGSGNRDYFIKDITLENADGSKVVKAMNPADPLLWNGVGTSAYVTQSASDVPTRTLVDYTANADVGATGVTLDSTTLTIQGTNTATLVATVAPSDASDKSVTWSSSAPTVATVSTAGVVTGVGAGSATITVKTTDGNFEATCAVTVSAVAVTGVSLNSTTLTIEVGQSRVLTATVAPANAINKAVTWTSSDAAVATVSATGAVTGVSVGTTTITVKTTDGNFAATCALTVSASTGGISILEVKARNGTVSDIAADYTGYTADITGTYTGGYAYFKVDLGTKKLSDFTKVTLKADGLAGDTGYKRWMLFVSDTEFSNPLGNYIGNLADNSNPESLNYTRLNYPLTPPDDAAKIGPQIHLGNATAGFLTDVPITLPIDATAAAALDDKTILYFSIAFGANPVKFAVKDIKFE